MYIYIHAYRGYLNACVIKKKKKWKKGEELLKNCLIN